MEQQYLKYQIESTNQYYIDHQSYLIQNTGYLDEGHLHLGINFDLTIGGVITGIITMNEQEPDYEEQCSTEYDTVCSIKFENPCETVWERKCVTNFIDDSPHVTYKKEGEDIDVVCVPDKDGIVFIVLNEKFPADSVRAGRTEACCRIPHPGSGHEYILLWCP